MDNRCQFQPELGHQLYGLQGIAGFPPEHQLNQWLTWEFTLAKPRPRLAAAVANWLASGAATSQHVQQAKRLQFRPFDMGFSLGSDSGLKGLPGQLVSGDSGYLGSLEAAYTLWKGQQQPAAIVPFLGAGEIRSVQAEPWNLKTLLAQVVGGTAGCRDKPGIWSWVGYLPLRQETVGFGMTGS